MAPTLAQHPTRWLKHFSLAFDRAHAASLFLAIYDDHLTTIEQSGPQERNHVTQSAVLYRWRLGRSCCAEYARRYRSLERRRFRADFAGLQGRCRQGGGRRQARLRHLRLH
ncbi:hypothetical protein MPL3365_280040 [Mesorhizobium plurifarium]|uniref:Uncharacterized protein n=1 Tax=Mesorhizobium plurifarium TaxID=69974 RepID=A0A090GD64_MESPL|nr:hypothetical protein MPL3365_280040 [Mesorhizobium plurifarium]